MLNSNGWRIDKITWSYPKDWQENIWWVRNQHNKELNFEFNKEKKIDLSFLFNDDGSASSVITGSQTGSSTIIGALGGTPEPGQPSGKMYIVKIEVKDNEGDTAEAYAIVNVHFEGNEEGIPVADAGGPYYVQPDESYVTFDSSKSHDTDEYNLDANGYKIECIRWDFNNDGKWDTSLSLIHI